MATKKARCAAEVALAMLEGRWKVLILRELFSGTRRFGELQRAVDGVSQKVLTEQLRELESDGLISRTIFAQVPPRVEYALTPRGRSLKTVLAALHQWGGSHSDNS